MLQKQRCKRADVDLSTLLCRFPNLYKHGCRNFEKLCKCPEKLGGRGVINDPMVGATRIGHLVPDNNLAMLDNRLGQCRTGGFDRQVVRD